MKDLFESRVNNLSGQTTQLRYYCHKCAAGCPTALTMENGPNRILRLIQPGQMQQRTYPKSPVV